MKILKIALIIVIFIILILAITGTNIFGAVLVNNISLEKRGDSTFVTIMANNPFQFAASSVPAKEGRPFRILIDCKSALHNLPKYEFRNLPAGIITSIRTSQYQTDPNQVVRIVLDAAKSVNFKVRSTGNSTVVTIVSLGEPNFEKWWASSTPTATPATTSVEKAEPVTPTETPEPAVVSTSPETSLPLEPTPTTQPTESSTTEPTAETTPTAETPEPSESTVASTEPKTPLDTSSTSVETTPTETVVAQPATTETSTVTTETPAVETVVNPDTQPTPVSTEATQVPEAVDTTTLITKPVPTEEQETLAKETTLTPIEPSLKAMAKKQISKTTAAQVTPILPEKTESEITDESEVQVKVTPPTTTETEGEAIVKVVPNLIQEKALQSLETFPKRKMVQYRSYGRRDPFSPLIGEKKVTEFGQVPIPSIENLKLVGILQDLDGSKALLEDNQGYGYIMEPGDRVKNGSVILVDEDRVVFQIQEYGWSRNVALDLYNIENK